MKKFYLIFFALLLSVNSCFATRYVTQNNITPNYNPNIYNQNYYDASGFNRLSQFEQSFYGRTYSNQNPNTRLSRLERSVFNRTYSNLPFDERMNNLIMNYNNNYNSNYSKVSSKSRKINNFMNGLSNIFYGMPTGMTPQIQPTYGIDPNWGRQNQYYGRDGWRINNESIGSGMGVKILD